jgi:hypothetical protein
VAATIGKTAGKVVTTVAQTVAEKGTAVKSMRMDNSEVADFLKIPADVKSEPATTAIEEDAEQRATANPDNSAGQDSLKAAEGSEIKTADESKEEDAANKDDDWVEIDRNSVPRQPSVEDVEDEDGKKKV